MSLTNFLRKNIYNYLGYRGIEEDPSIDKLIEEASGLAAAGYKEIVLVGINLSLEQQLVIMLALMLTSKGIAGVPRVSLIVLAGTLTSFNIPIIGVAILLGIDQILDMGRTTVNLIGNCVATVVIARWENSFDYAKMNDFIRRKNLKINTFGKLAGEVSFQKDFIGKK